MDEKVLTKLEELKKLIKEQTLLKKEVLTSREASVYLGLSLSYLYHLTGKNIVKAYKPNGGKLYFKRKELYSWMLSKQKAIHSNWKPTVSEQPINQGRN
jgi:excisionase family DNA binding protein